MIQIEHRLFTVSSIGNINLFFFFFTVFDYAQVILGAQIHTDAEKTAALMKKALLLKCKPVLLSFRTLQPRPAEGVGGHGQLSSLLYSNSTSLYNF